MKLIVVGATLAAACGLTMPNSQPPAVTVAGVRWESSFAAAKARAKAEHKPILFLQMFGKLDDDFC
jgi:hypothetical protein